jgi:hypothetical protein
VGNTPLLRHVSEIVARLKALDRLAHWGSKNKTVREARRMGRLRTVRFPPWEFAFDARCIVRSTKLTLAKIADSPVCRAQELREGCAPRPWRRADRQQRHQACWVSTAASIERSIFARACLPGTARRRSHRETFSTPSHRNPIHPKLSSPPYRTVRCPSAVISRYRLSGGRRR